MNNELSSIAEYVIDKLKGKVIIHRYDAFSTNSIYLKFDYGVANSLRISDHKGYKHLDYRFNIILGRKTHDINKGREYTKEFFPAEDVDLVIKKILENKRSRQKKYRDYNAVVEKAKKERNQNLSFWRCCREIN